MTTNSIPQIIYLVIILVLLVVSFKRVVKEDGDINYTTNRAYPQNGDSIAILLGRIHWAAYRPGRISWYHRYLFWAFILSIVLFFLLGDKINSPFIFLQVLIVIWIFLLYLHSYFTWHSDKFSNYAITENVKHLEKHLNTKRETHVENLIPPLKSHKSYGKAWNFMYV